MIPFSEAPRTVPFVVEEHNGHRTWGEVTEKYTGHVVFYIDDDGTVEGGRIHGCEETSEKFFDVQGCYPCNVRFSTEDQS